MQGTRPHTRAFFQRINKLADIMASTLTLLILVTVLIQIAGRLLGNPYPWTEEGTRVFFICMIFLGLGIGFRRAESARVTTFLAWTPKFVQRSSKWIYATTTIGFFGFMLYTGMQLVQQQIAMNEMGSAFMIPMWLVGLFLPLSAVLGIIGVVESLLLHPETIAGGK